MNILVDFYLWPEADKVPAILEQKEFLQGVFSNCRNRLQVNEFVMLHWQ